MSLTRGFMLMPRSLGKVMNCFIEVEAIVAPNVAPKISRIADGLMNAAGEPPSSTSATIMAPSADQDSQSSRPWLGPSLGVVSP